MRKGRWGVGRAAGEPRGERDRPARFASVIVAAVLIYLALFTAAALAVFAATGNEPAALIAGVFGVAGTELLSLAAKRIFDKRKDEGQ